MIPQRKWRLSRRAFLGGAGAAIGLPWLEAMTPVGHASPRASSEPQRLLVYFVPNGVHLDAWTPAEVGAGWSPTPILRPLVDAGLADDVLLVSGLQNQVVAASGNGGHARGMGGWLTATPINPERYGEVTNSTSMDQVYADFIGEQTGVPSMQLGMPDVRPGHCDAHLCAYVDNISWSGNTPLPAETSVQAAFDELFAGFDPGVTAEEIARRKALRLSVIDYALDDAKALHTKLGRSDRQKLEQYLDAVRDLEQRVDATGTEGECALDPNFPPESGDDFEAQVRVMTDIMVKAFQCDRTRVISFLYGRGQSGRDYGFMGASGNHHGLTHHERDESKIDKVIDINTFEVAQLAYLLSELKNSPEGDGSVLDNSIVYFSSSISDGDRHYYTDLPIVIGGRGGGTIPVGQHLRFTALDAGYDVYNRDLQTEHLRKAPPVANLFIDLLQKLGVDIDEFGDSGTGPLGL